MGATYFISSIERRAFSTNQKASANACARRINLSFESILFLKTTINYDKLPTEISQWLSDRYAGNLCFGYLSAFLSINTHAY